MEQTFYPKIEENFFSTVEKKVFESSGIRRRKISWNEVMISWISKWCLGLWYPIFQIMLHFAFFGFLLCNKSNKNIFFVLTSWNLHAFYMSKIYFQLKEKLCVKFYSKDSKLKDQEYRIWNRNYFCNQKIFQFYWSI